MTDNRMAAAVSESYRAKHEAEELTASLRRARVEWEETLRDRFRQHPYATLAAAVGVGYVVGGGLVPGILRPIVGAGGRLALSLFLQNVLTGALEGNEPRNDLEEE
jgi:hypothetical protein